MKKIIFIIIGIFFIGYGFSQSSVIKPKHINWLADGKLVSLKTGFEKGVPSPEKLSLVVVFPNDIDQNIAKEKLKFKFNWYYYYATKKEFMDSYTVSYDKGKVVESNNSFRIKSSRSNIHKGWWEVEVIAKYDNKPVKFNNIVKYQIYIQ